MGLFDKFRVHTKAYDETESVVANLTALVQTRRGFSTYQRDLGLSDVGGAEDPKATASRVEGELREMIARYEPRLKEPRVKVDTRPGSRRLGLKVSGRIEGSERVFYLEWDPRSPGAPARGAPPIPDEEG